MLRIANNYLKKINRKNDTTNTRVDAAGEWKKNEYTRAMVEEWQNLAIVDRTVVYRYNIGG